MSGPALGRYHFQSWARRGIGASLDDPDTGAPPDRASLDVQLLLDVAGGSTPNPVPAPAVTVKLFGPGDIAGVDPRMIVRTEPRQFTVNFEPNYLCGIEFDTPDFPWLFTPASPNGDRLHPWVSLIVLKTSEFTLPAVAPHPLPVIDVLNGSALQDLSVSWAWGHVQISGDASLADTLATAPGNVVSRLLCPRRLDPETSYTAFLVPAYQIGVMAGTGQDVSGTHTSAPAWTPGTPGPITLPFYYRFDFHTSDEGDFESLVRKLTPRLLPAEVGERPMDVSRPDPGIPSAGGPLQLEGALHSVSSQPSPWAGPDKEAFQAALQDWINQTRPATLDPANPGPDPVVVPPIYGRWAAAIQSVDRTAAGWENELNLDPRNRSGAGMGTQIVQGERTALMASAWQQVAGVIQANQALRQAQLARAAGQQIYRQHFLTAQPETLMNLTSPLQSRLLASPATVKVATRNSRIPERMLSGAFRKIAGLRQHLRATRGGAPTLLGRVNSGAIAIVPAVAPPGGMVPIEQVSQRLVPAWASDLLRYRRWILVALVAFVALRRARRADRRLRSRGLGCRDRPGPGGGGRGGGRCRGRRGRRRGSLAGSPEGSRECRRRAGNSLLQFHAGADNPSGSPARLPSRARRNSGAAGGRGRRRFRPGRGFPRRDSRRLRRISGLARQSTASARSRYRDSAHDGPDARSTR